jgi:hypothetical protein
MTAESTELTFVRCPACRSLVPASASRCRICNNHLSGGEKSEDNDSAAGGRVRQKTISASAEEVSAVVEGGQGSQVSSGEQAGAPLADEDFDPLAAFLEEDEAPTKGDDDSEEDDGVSVAAISDSSEDEDDAADALAVNESATEEVVAESNEVHVEPTTTHEAAAEEEDAQVLEAEEAAAVVAPEISASDADLQPEVTAASAVEAVPQQEPSVGASRRNFGGFNRPGQEARGQESTSQERSSGAPQFGSRPHDQRKPFGGQVGRDMRNGNAGSNAGTKEATQRPEQARGGKSWDDGRSAGGAPQGRPTDKQQERTPAPGPRPGKASPGRLFGWLVSYEHQDGRSIELREGKFFVSSSSIKGNDLVLDDASVSTPHALMSISSESGFLLQDLMSDRGLFVRSREGAHYQREEGIVQVQNGDWIRFGDVEFLVTFIPTSKF